jgi:DMSO/TMAO reductase YedYZ molybdopterin-dependent catalytic subunit
VSPSDNGVATRSFQPDAPVDDLGPGSGPAVTFATTEHFNLQTARALTVSEANRDDGYRTNLPLEDVTGGRAWIAYQFDGQPLDPEHGGPARLLVPHLYFWKSASGCADCSS